MNDEDIDILWIDNKIQSNFNEEIKKLPIYKERLKEYEKTIQKLNNKNTENMVKNEIEKIKYTIENIENSYDKNFYIAETIELINKYKDILNTPIKITFIGKVKIDNFEKDKIIKKYITIAQKYYPVSFKSKEKKIKIVCENCSNKKDFIIDENIYICPICFVQQDIIQYSTSYKDSDRVNIITKYSYDRRVHFKDCINQYQGKQNCNIDPEIYEKLEDAFIRHSLISPNKSIPKDIRMSNITKEHVLMFLKDLGYSKHYENFILIHYVLTGQKPDDISHLEEKLLYDFDQLIEMYDSKFKNKIERANFISTQVVFYQLLQKHKHPCKREDFVILKDIDRKSFHDDICRELFELLSWNFTPLI